MSVHDENKLRRDWEPFVERVVQIANRECGRRGYAVMSLTILIDNDAKPVLWSEPTLTKLEPRMGAGGFLRKVTEIFATETLAPDKG